MRKISFFCLLLIITFSVPVYCLEQAEIEKMGKLEREVVKIELKAIEYAARYDFANAAKCYEEALLLEEKMNTMAKGDSQVEKVISVAMIETLADAASCYKELEQIKKTEQYLVRASILAEGDFFKQSELFMDLASLFLECGDYKKYESSCCSIVKAAYNNKSLEVGGDDAVSHFKQIHFLDKLRNLILEYADFLYDVKKFDEALEVLNGIDQLQYLLIALNLNGPQFMTDIGVIETQKPELLPDALGIFFELFFDNIAGLYSAYSTRGKCLRAKEDYEKSLSTFNQVEEYLKDIDIKSIGEMFRLIHAEIKKVEGALEPEVREHIDNILSRDLGSALEVEYAKALIDTKVNRAVTYQKMGELDKARELFNEAVRECERVPYYKGKILPLILFHLGEISYENKDYDEAAKQALEAKNLLEFSPFDMDTPWKINSLIGKLCEQKSDYSDALSAYKSAFETIEKYQAITHGGSSREEFLGERIEPYEGLVRSYTQLGKTAEALNYVEKGKARSLSEHFATVIPIDKFPLDVRKKYNTLELRITKKYRELEAKASRNLSEQKQLQASEELAKLAEEFNVLFSTAMQGFSDIITGTVVSPAEIQKIIGADTVIFVYFYDVASPPQLQKTYLFVIDSMNIEEFVLDISPRDLEKKVRIMRKDISQRIDNWKENSAALYKILMEPGKKHLDGKKRIVIVPHKTLHYLPFSALVDGNGSPIIESLSIAYAPSLTALKLCDDMKKTEGKALLAFSLGNSGGSGFSPLPGTLAEVDEIMKLFPDKTVIKEKEFSIQRVKGLLDGKSVIHFATHGVVDADNPKASALITGNGEKLTVENILELQIHPRIVTLSACQTGLGKLFPGDDQVGLTRAFMFAGSPAILSSLWSVSDESTAKLMIYFYGGLMTDLPKDEALRQAEIKLMKEYPHPFFWAPFILTGSWN